MRYHINLVSLLLCAVVAMTSTAFAQPDISVEPPEIKLFMYDVNSDFTFLDYRTYNRGTEELRFWQDGVYITGPDANQFELATYYLFNPLQPGSYRWDRLIFRPNSRGTKHAILNVTTNDPDEFTTAIPLMGVAAYPELLISANPDFGNWSVSDGPTTIPVELLNIGQQPLEFTTVGIELISNGSFYIVDTPTTSPIGPGSSRGFVVAFNPFQEGQVNGTLRIHTNDPQAPVKELVLTGFGTWAEIVVSPGQLQFGKKTLSDTEPHILSTEITSWGTEPLEFMGSGFSITGPGGGPLPPGPAQFTLVDIPSTAPLSGGPQNPRRVQVAFKPTSLGIKTARLRISTNDPNNPNVEVFLTGEGVPARQFPFIGPYDGYGPGSSTIGLGGHYPSLYAACEAISSVNSLTGGDWSFHILNNLTEPQNSMLTQENTGGNKLIFRPAPGTSSTIHFTQASNNPLEFPGHFIIGARFINNQAGGTWKYISADNVVIDGANTPGAATRNLAFKNLDWAGGSTTMIHVAGDSDSTLIQNCSFFHTNGFHSSVNGGMGAVEFFGERTPPAGPDLRIFSTPDDWVVRNCKFVINGTMEAPAISSNFRFGSFSNYQVTPSSLGNVIEHNEIETSQTAIYVRDSDEVAIRHNKIQINLPDTPLRVQRGIYYSPSSEVGSSATANIDSNRIQFDGSVPTSNEQVAIAVGSRSTTSILLITNNMISGISAPVPYQNQTNRRRVAISNEADTRTTAIVAHNSINFHSLAGTSNTLGMCVAFDHTQLNQFFGGYSEIRNNIVRMAAEGGVIFRRMPGLGVIQSDYNILFTYPGGSMGMITGNPPTVYTSFTDWQLGTGNDLNSLNFDPAIAVGMGNPQTWIMNDFINPDMHWTGYPGISVPRLNEVPKDFDGEDRYPLETMPGADEVEQGSAVGNWKLY